MAKTEAKYGNVNLGQINKILISIVGESAFYFYCEKHKEKWNLNWQSEEAFKKYTGRLLREEDSDCSGLNPSYENSIYKLVFLILEDFAKKFQLPTPYLNATLIFVNNFYSGFSEKQYPIYETYHLFESYLYNALKEFRKDSIKMHLQSRHLEFVNFTFSSALKKYQFTFDLISKMPQFKSKEKFYEKLAAWCTEQNKKTNPDNFKIVEPEHFKKIIALCVSDAKNPSWKNMQAILEFLASDKETEFIKGFLIEAYISSNIENFIKKETELPNERVETFFKSFEFIRNAQIDLFENHIKENQFFGLSKEKYDSSVKTIANVLDSIFKKYIYLEDENQTELLISDIKNAAPQAQDFYCNWIRGYIELAKENIVEAENLYKKAFESRRFAGSHFEFFIKQAFALCVFADSNSNTVRESIDPSKNSTTPLPKDARRYWNYGYATGIFDKSAEDTYLEYFNKEVNFYSVFSADMFFPNAKSKTDSKNNILNSLGIVITDEDFEKSVEKDYQKLCSLTNQTINNRLRMFNSESSTKISPISLALYHASQFEDRRFIDLLKDWLGLSGNKQKFENIDVNIVSDAGVTPVSAAIVQYKLLRLRENQLDEKSLQDMKDYKMIALQLIKMSKPEYLNVESKKNYRHPLQEAIESYDLEIVKAIIEKGLDINGLKISADAVSPVYYTLMRIVGIKNPSKIMAGMRNQNSLLNVNWNKMNVAGLSSFDKMNNYFSLEEKMSSELGKETYELLCHAGQFQIFGNPKTYENQLASLKNICFYLIDQTNNQDEFILHNKYANQSCTSLYFAVEIDDVDICRKLLRKGANPNLYLPIEIPIIPNTFLYRVISFNAWNVLEMYLTEFSELAKITINDYDNPYQFTPLSFFLLKMLESKNTKDYKGFSFVNKIYELFMQCGANQNIPSRYGSAKELLRQFQYL